jgi:hypothetical protein
VWVGFTRPRGSAARARLFCVSGCTCTEVLVQRAQGHAHGSAALHVTQSPSCQVGVQLLPPSGSSSHSRHSGSSGSSGSGGSSSSSSSSSRRRHYRFKVTGVMVTRAVDYHTPGSEHAHHFFLHPQGQ